jgi:hypothetical protein
MRITEITEGAEYGAVLGNYIPSRPRDRIARIRRVRVVSTKATALRRGGSSYRTKRPVRAVEVEALEAYDDRGWRGTKVEVGDRRVIESRFVLGPWSEIAREIEEHRAAELDLEERNNRAERVGEAIVNDLASHYKIDPDEARIGPRAGDLSIRISESEVEKIAEAID